MRLVVLIKNQWRYWQFKLANTGLIVALCCLTSLSAHAGITYSIKDTSIEAKIELAGGVETDLEIKFDNAIGLNVANLGISAELISITDPLLIGRLPSFLQNSIPAAFPMMITIEPDANQGFGFSGMSTIELHTHNLIYTANTPIRLFKAPLGGQFRDITDMVGSGSIRVRGHTGGFSQFLLVADLRSVDSMITDKLNYLKAGLLAAASDIPSGLYSDLNLAINNTENEINDDEFIDAINALNDFIELVEENQATNIPNVWRSSRDLVNHAGELLAAANTLRFSLRMATNGL